MPTTQRAAAAPAPAAQADDTEAPDIPGIPEPQNVVEAVIAVMRAVRSVGKDGFNQQQRFNFRGVDGVVNAVGPYTRKYGLVINPREVKEYVRQDVEVGNKNTKMGHVQLIQVYEFMHSNPRTHEITTFTAEVPAESMDSGDKATAKACSVAYRTLQIQAFNLPTQEKDPDEDVYERSTPLPSQEAVKLAVTEALTEANPENALRLLLHRDHEFGGADRLAKVTVFTNEGSGTAVEYINHVLVQHRQQAQGDNQDPPAATQQQAAQAPTTQQQTSADRPPAAPSVPEPLRSGRQEASVQAEVLQMSLRDHLAPVLQQAQVAGPGELTDRHLNLLGAHVVAKRSEVVTVLNRAGHPEMADQYRKSPKDGWADRTLLSQIAHAIPPRGAGDGQGQPVADAETTAAVDQGIER